MNLPNKLTITRMVMIPFFVLFMKLPEILGAQAYDPNAFGNPGQYGWCRIVALIIFIAASLTDTADGYIARKYNLITDFGKFMDPLADKLLVIISMICLISTNEIPDWVVMIIIAREFIISGIRLVAADNGVVIAASKWGKSKTIVTMVMIVVVLSNLFPRALEIVLIYAALILTIVSLMDYIIKNKAVLSNQK